MKAASLVVVAACVLVSSACGLRHRSEAVDPASPASLRWTGPRPVPLRDRYARGRLELLRAINSDRLAAGVQPVALDSLASVAAQRHAEAMAEGGYLSHYDTEGRAPYERLAAIGGTAHVLENVYRWRERDEDPFIGEDPWHRFDPRAAQASLLASAPHRAAILDPHRTGVGIGFAVDPDDREVFVVQEFVAHHATLLAPQWSAYGRPARLWGRVLRSDVRPLLFVVRRESSSTPSSFDAPAPGPYDDGGSDARLVPPWSFAVLPDGVFALDLGADLAPGRYYAVLYVAPRSEVDVAMVRRRAYPGQGWPGAAVLFEVRET